MTITIEEWKIIDSAFSVDFTDEVEIALRDLFALGCYPSCGRANYCREKSHKNCIDSYKNN